MANERDSALNQFTSPSVHGTAPENYDTVQPVLGAEGVQPQNPVVSGHGFPLLSSTASRVPSAAENGPGNTALVMFPGPHSAVAAGQADAQSALFQAPPVNSGSVQPNVPIDPVLLGWNTAYNGALGGTGNMNTQPDIPIDPMLLSVDLAPNNEPSFANASPTQANPSVGMPMAWQELASVDPNPAGLNSLTHNEPNFANTPPALDLEAGMPLAWQGPPQVNPSCVDLNSLAHNGASFTNGSQDPNLNERLPMEWQELPQAELNLVNLNSPINMDYQQAYHQAQFDPFVDPFSVADLAAQAANSLQGPDHLENGFPASYAVHGYDPNPPAQLLGNLPGAPPQPVPGIPQQGSGHQISHELEQEEPHERLPRGQGPKARRSAARRAQGLCGDCGKPNPALEFVGCPSCRQRRRDTMLINRKRRRQQRLDEWEAEERRKKEKRKSEGDGADDLDGLPDQL
ncbi:hypothetical protein MMYC01_204175 [Madurella mycetomatis]|uniref:Uncharacterized protein n=1 Tax=Madurella mycetomatis TaxID=100816 RepID=A0A175VXK3_9PEZI|nr:hypothetical protein MMYC01_206745 [Madurella mycetomatis]KXX79139.1 hypothetical protein MMYC01_204175 [Madurella mycetomatis]